MSWIDLKLFCSYLRVRNLKQLRFCA